MIFFKEQNPANAMVYVNQTINALALCRTGLTLLDGQPEDVILGGADLGDVIGDIVDVCYLFTDQSYTDGNDTLLARPGHHRWHPSYHCGSLISRPIRRDWRLDVPSNFFLLYLSKLLNYYLLVAPWFSTSSAISLPLSQPSWVLSQGFLEDFLVEFSSPNRVLNFVVIVVTLRDCAIYIVNKQNSSHTKSVRSCGSSSSSNLFLVGSLSVRL